MRSPSLHATPEIRPLAERATLGLASFVTIGVVVLAWSSGPRLHQWLSVVLAAAVAGAAVRPRRHPANRIASFVWLAVAALVTRQTWRLEAASPLLAWLDTVVMAATALAAAWGIYAVGRLVGPGRALLAALASLAVLACAGLVLERSPGARLWLSETALHKGPWPHRVLGQWYPPGGKIRSFYASDRRHYYDPPAGVEAYWRLNLHSSRDVAELHVTPGPQPTLRIAITRADGGEVWGIQLNEAPLVLRAGTPYELRFAARADRPRTISVGIGEWHAPYGTLGYARTLDVGRDWTPVVERITLPRGDDSANIHFDLGQDSASVELRDVVLTDLANGQPVLPDPLPYSLTHQLNDLGCRGGTGRAATSDGRRARRILVLGDAFALGLGVRDGDLFGTRLGRHLEASGGMPGAAGAPVEVMTCAVPGWGTRQQRQFYESVRRQFGAELIIVVSTWNDGRLRPDEAPASPADAAGGAAAAGIATELLQLRDLASVDGARVGVVVFRNTAEPIWQNLLDAVAPLPGAGVPVLDLWPALRARGPAEPLGEEPPRAHVPNSNAHAVAAAATAAFVRSEGLLP